MQRLRWRDSASEGHKSGSKISCPRTTSAYLARPRRHLAGADTPDKIFHGRVNHEQDIVVHFSYAEGSAVQKRAQGKQGPIFGSVGSGTLESSLMSAHVQPSALLLSVPTKFSSRRHDRAARAAEHRAVRCKSEARSNRSGTIASECPPATVRLGLYSFPTLFSSVRVHRPSRRPPVQDDCKQVQFLPAPLFSPNSFPFLDLWTTTISTNRIYAVSVCPSYSVLSLIS
jgi:hypothetical protein